MQIETVVKAPRGGISPLAPAYYLGRPAQVWFEALAPAGPHFDIRHAICRYPGQKRLNVRPTPGRRALIDMPLCPLSMISTRHRRTEQ